MGRRESVHLGLPDQLAGARVHRVGKSAAVAEKRGIVRSGIGLDAADADGRSHAAVGVEVPADAARRRVERIDGAAGASDKHPPVRDGGMRVGVQRGGKSESPLHFQAAKVGGAEPGLRGGLKARVEQILAPAVPQRAGRCGSPKSGAGAVHMAAAAGAVSRGCAKDLPVMNSAIARRPASDCRIGHRDHGPRFHGRQHPLRRHGMQRFVGGSAIHSGFVAGSTASLVDGRAVLGGNQVSGPQQEQANWSGRQRNGNCISGWILSR